MAISKIKSESIDLSDTGYTFGDLLVSGDLTIDTSSLTVDSTNNRVGIGTTTPSTVFHINASNPNIRLQDSDGTNQYAGVSGSSGGLYLSARNNTTEGDIVFEGNNGTTVSELVRIVGSSGRVGIGTSSPSSTLSVKTSAGTFNVEPLGASAVQLTSATSLGFNIGSNYNYEFDVNGTEVMRINGTNNYVGIGTNSPETLLHLAGGATASSGGAYAGITMTNRFDSPDNSWTIEPQRSGVSNTGLSIRDRTDNRIDMAFDGTGKVGIGTASPSSTLDVTGAGGGLGSIYVYGGGSGSVDTRLIVGNTGNGGSGRGTGILIKASGSSSSVDVVKLIGYQETAAATANNAKFAIQVANSSGTLTERMRINGSGYVGIGTTSPTTQLYVDGAGSGTFSPYNDPLIVEGTDYTIGLHIKGVNSQAMIIYNRDGSNGWFTGLENSGHFKFENMTSMNGTAVGNAKDNGNPVLMLRTDGVACFNTTAPSSNEQVTILTGNDTRVMSFKNSGGGEAGYIYMNSGGSGVTYSTSSDYRLKENVVDLTNGIERLKQLQVRRFNFIDDDKTLDGFIAHEVQPIVPEAVTGEKDGMHTYIDEEDGIEKTKPSYQGIDQSKLVPLLTASLQEAITRIESLETENASIKSRLDALEN